MKVKAMSNNVSILPKRMQNYAYGQNEKGVILGDLNIGEEYIVYGYAELRGEPHYLIEKSDAPNWLWWMSARFYEQDPSDIKKQLPSDWVQVTYRDEFSPKGAENIMIGPKIFHENEAEIEDYTKKGQQAVKQIKQDNKEFLSAQD